MNKTQKFTVSGGFHNAGWLTIRAKVDPRGGIMLSEAQAKKIGNHMCGMKGCICGMHHGWKVDGVSSNDLSEALYDANAKTYMNSYRNR